MTTMPTVNATPMGLVRAASIVREIRSEAANSVLCDNGDFL